MRRFTANIIQRLTINWKLDLFYIENYSFLLDIKLLFMTVKIFFQKEVSEGVDDQQVNALRASGTGEPSQGGELLSGEETITK